MQKNGKIVLNFFPRGMGAHMSSMTPYLFFLFWLFGFGFLWRIPYLKNDESLAMGSSKISILVPARNEERTLVKLLTSLKHQTLKPFEIIVIDDQSEDATAEVARREGCTVMISKDLPAGWAGKPWACWQGANQATGDIFLFLDADTFLEPDGLSRIVSTYLRKGGLLSIQPFHRMKRNYERLSAVFNIIAMAGMNAFTLLGSKLKPTGAFGPCMVCSREDYFLVGGHEKARGEVLESLAIGKEFLKASREVRCYGGKGSILFRMYPDGLQSLVEGFSKGFGTGANATSVASLLMIVCWVFGGVGVTRHLIQSAILGNPMDLLGWTVLDILYIFQIHWMLFRIGNFGFSTALLFQIPLLFFVIVFAYSILRIFLVQKVRWKGRDIKPVKGRN
jgi:4,4'-diaponeurosporenoate glycosyltransferase